MKKLAILLLVLLLVGCQSKRKEEIIQVHFINEIVPFSTKSIDIIKGKSIGDQWFEPEMPGYTFIEWKTLENESVTEQTVFTKNTWLYPVYSENMYLVTFNTNGGEPIEPAMLSFSNFDQAQFVTSQPWHAFVGWYYDAAFTRSVDSTTKLIEDITVYGKWEPKSYKLTYHLTGTTVIEVYFNAGDKVVPYVLTYPENFIGWSELSKNTLFNFSSMPSRHVDVYIKTGTNE